MLLPTWKARSKKQVSPAKNTVDNVSAVHPAKKSMCGSTHRLQINVSSDPPIPQVSKEWREECMSQQHQITNLEGSEAYTPSSPMAKLLVAAENSSIQSARPSTGCAFIAHPGTTKNAAQKMDHQYSSKAAKCSSRKKHSALSVKSGYPAEETWAASKPAEAIEFLAQPTSKGSLLCASLGLLLQRNSRSCTNGTSMQKVHAPTGTAPLPKVQRHSASLTAVANILHRRAHHKKANVLNRQPGKFVVAAQNKQPSQ